MPRSSKTRNVAPNNDYISDNWLSMQRYKSFSCNIPWFVFSYHTVGGRTFKLGDTIFVRSKKSRKNKRKERIKDIVIDEMDSIWWIATIMEVRAINGRHVWVLVRWFYRPNELPCDRQVSWQERGYQLKSPRYYRCVCCCRTGDTLGRKDWNHFARSSGDRCLKDVSVFYVNGSYQDGCIWTTLKMLKEIKHEIWPALNTWTALERSQDFFVDNVVSYVAFCGGVSNSCMYACPAGDSRNGSA